MLQGRNSGDHQRSVFQCSLRYASLVTRSQNHAGLWFKIKLFLSGKLMFKNRSHVIRKWTRLQKIVWSIDVSNMIDKTYHITCND